MAGHICGNAVDKVLKRAACINYGKVVHLHAIWTCLIVLRRRTTQSGLEKTMLLVLYVPVRLVATDYLELFWNVGLF